MPPANAPQFGQQPGSVGPQARRFVRQAPVQNPKPAFNPQPQQPQQTANTGQQQNTNQQGFNPNPPFGQRPNLADMLGLPAGMTPNQAHHLEIDARNPYDLDVPEPGAAGYNPAMDIPATGMGAGHPLNLPATYPQNQNMANQINPAPPSGQFPVRSQQTPYGAFPGSPGGVFPYALRMNCQCDSAGDCNQGALAMGMRFQHDCRPGFVCCCRSG